VNEVVHRRRPFDRSRDVVSGARIALEPPHIRPFFVRRARDGNEVVFRCQERQKRAADDSGCAENSDVHLAVLAVSRSK
jgi:hypothetical protein